MKARYCACALFLVAVSLQQPPVFCRQLLQNGTGLNTSIPLQPAQPILVNAALAESTKPANLPCPPIDNNQVSPVTLMPLAANYRPVFQIKGEGLRNYSCGPAGLDLNSLSISTFTSVGNFPYNFSGNAFYNSVRSINVTVADSAGGWPCAWPTIADVENDKLPEIQVLDPQTNATLGTIIADSLRVEFPTPGVPLMKRRWPVFIITGNIIPWTQYIVMNETTGGAPPPAAACEGQQWATAPYSALYTYWTC